MTTAASAITGGGTLVLAQRQASTSTPTVTDRVTLRLVPRRKKKSVKWAEDVADIDENSGKMKSKKCCIFHKQRQFGEWSDDEDSDPECDCDTSRQQQQPTRQPKPQPGTQMKQM
eukprot:GHUV01004375.1.p2 GENE.GHUV01004375.1~~GHUV01004375.1.p2  ORF type:complete len:115 (+),score=28.37 GHUV01004375.1:387-731(+)